MRILIYVLFLLPIYADQFSDYWYGGKAEVAVYDLEQWGYGEPRQGTATLVFVTEPFSKQSQVKLDNPSTAREDRTTVLKLNKVKKYLTGLYPYSVMSSAFAQVGTGNLLKANTSVQEWCGHTYLQANMSKPAHYEFHQFSYFESQGDQDGKLTNTILEEEVMLRLRLNKFTLQDLPKLITPLQEYARLSLIPYNPLPATVEQRQEGENQVITINYDHPLELKTEITVSKEFPYVIQGWQEFKQGQVNKATLKSVQQLPYWQMNAPKFENARKEIGLEQ